MSLKRKGEKGNFPFRTERIFSVGNEWYFTTRDGKDMGPFKSKVDAEGEITIYLRELAIGLKEIKDD